MTKTVLKTVLILTLALTSALAQQESDRWSRVYTGDDATIDLLISSVKLQPEHIIVVTFRTVMSSAQPLKKEKPGVKYQTLIETIDFNPIAKQYRYRELRWLDTARVEVDRYQPNTPPEWRPIKRGGMVDRMLETASASAPFGSWRVKSYRFGESGTQEPSVMSDAAKLLGTVVRLSPRKAEFGTKICDLPDYESKSLTNSDVVQQLGIQLTALGIKTDPVEAVSIKCRSDGWKPPQSLLVRLPEGGLLMLWDGIFLHLEKTDSHGKPILIRRSHTKDRKSRYVVNEGAIIRGDKTKRQLALVFTGDEFADGAATIIRVLKNQNVKGSFFFTGRFYRNPAFKSQIQALRNDGHYLGAHSNDHLLYCDWTNRNKLLVTRDIFDTDLDKNYEAMSAFGISKNAARFFLPPFEWYNQTVSDWTEAFGLQLINFTPGTSSNADYTTPNMNNYVSSEAILQRIKSYEAKDPHGLNGFILLTHIGVAPERTDKFYNHLDDLIDWLKTKKYELVRIDELLDNRSTRNVR